MRRRVVVIAVLVGTFIGDTAAYLGGRYFGMRKLAPRISPNKTVEGLVFGVLGATLAVWCAGLYQDWLTGWHALLIGFLVSLAAPLGDLFESMIKRDLEVKDTSRFFGAHGGVLDRLDAVLEMSAAMQAVAHTTADHKEAMAALREKRRPRFGGA